jgi:hypothetical protein
MKPPPAGDDRNIRDVDLDGYRLRTWDTYTSDRWGKSILGYALYAPGERKPLFIGEDFDCSPQHTIDSDECLRALLGFLTLRPGDTDAEYFEEYTAEQRAFAEGDAEDLQQWAEDDGPAFVDV